MGCLVLYSTYKHNVVVIKMVPTFMAYLFFLCAYIIIARTKSITMHNLTSCLIHSITLHLVLLPWQPIINIADWSTVCTIFLIQVLFLVAYRGSVVVKLPTMSLTPLPHLNPCLPWRFLAG